MLESFSLSDLGLDPDAMIANKYRVERMLAVGGMGAIVKAHHEVLDHPVAIKLMKPEFAKEKEASQRFLREARAAAKIRSECVARVTDVDLFNGVPYMVMEFLEGRDLEAVIEEGERVPIRDAVDYVLQALDGLGAAHALGVVHRDLKPSNLFLTKNRKGHPIVKVLDFGISKIVGNEPQSDGLYAGAVTGDGSLLGTPRYMSPEQIRSSRHVDRRTDIWAVGLILYELLARYPFEEEGAVELLTEIMTTTEPPIRSLRPEVPERLAETVHACLVKSRDDRMPDARTVLLALAPFASRRVRATLLDPDELESLAFEVEDEPSTEVSGLSLLEKTDELAAQEVAAEGRGFGETMLVEQAGANHATTEDMPASVVGKQEAFLIGAGGTAPMAAAPRGPGDRAKRATMPLAVGLGVLVIGAGGWMLTRTESAPSPTPETQTSAAPTASERASSGGHASASAPSSSAAPSVAETSSTVAPRSPVLPRPSPVRRPPRSPKPPVPPTVKPAPLIDPIDPALDERK